LAMFTAIRNSSSRVSSVALERRPGLVLVIDIRQGLPVAISHNEARGAFLDRPGRRERQVKRMPMLFSRTIGRRRLCPAKAWPYLLYGLRPRAPLQASGPLFWPALSLRADCRPIHRTDAVFAPPFARRLTDGDVSPLTWPRLIPGLSPAEVGERHAGRI
jgi:hypothetical protein